MDPNFRGKNFKGAGKQDVQKFIKENGTPDSIEFFGGPLDGVEIQPLVTLGDRIALPISTVVVEQPELAGQEGETPFTSIAFYEITIIDRKLQYHFAGAHPPDCDEA